MIQRIQSIYLLLAAILMAVGIFLPLLEVIFDNELVTLYAQGLFENDVLVKRTWGIVAIGIIAFAICVVSIFLFKKRKLQVKVIKFCIAFNVLWYITIFTYIYSLTQMTIEDFHLAFITHILAIILEIMAICKINKDEKLVRSLDRIR